MSEEILSFCMEALRLKRMLRNGWVFSGVAAAEVESVADHSYMVSLLAMLIALHEQEKEKKIDLEKVLIMALIHDLSESVSQDIDRRIAKFAPEEFTAFKKKLDKQALAFLLEKLSPGMQTKLSAIFEEYQQQQSPEARIVSEADRLETIFQLKEYIMLGKQRENFSEFYANFKEEKEKFQNPLVKELARLLLQEETEK
ncbi:MAG: HD domain-containing protein [Candidatus Heimdallarchaeota archaeon]